MKEQVLTLNSEIRQFTPDEIAEINVKVVKGKIAVLQGWSYFNRHAERAAADILTTERIGNMSLDLAVLKEYARREREFMERAADLDVVTKERDTAKKMYDDFAADDYAGRKCRVGIGRFSRSVLGGNHFQCHAPEEELEEHLESLGRRKDAFFARSRFRIACLQGQSSLTSSPTMR